MHRVLIVSGVGGVGKSAVAAAMAHVLASRGASFGLVDVDTLRNSDRRRGVVVMACRSMTR